jgi:hypothetical protein
MSWAEDEDWSADQIIVVPHAWRGDGLWHDMQDQTNDRIGAALRAMYANLLLQPLPPRLAKLVYQIRTQQETSRHAS